MTEPEPKKAPLPRRDLVFLDVETSGLNPYKHEIVEIAFVRTTWDCKPLKNFETKVLMQLPDNADPKALEINGYDEEVWKKDAVEGHVALDALQGFLDPDVLVVGQNAQFDWRFIQAAAEDWSVELPVPRAILCTLSMAWPLMTSGRITGVSLKSLCAYYRIPQPRAHRAMGDVEATIALYKRLCLGPEGSR
jgi:DNA polymerase III epsilon subunit-like protein